jgi:hypothetical protein
MRKGASEGFVGGERLVSSSAPFSDPKPGAVVALATIEPSRATEKNKETPGRTRYRANGIQEGAIGILSQRPEKQLGEGPDNLWRLRDGRFLVIECKNGSVSTTGISKAELGQVAQALSWFQVRYGNEPRVPIIIHPLDEVGPKATAPDGLGIISSQKLALLRKAFVDFVKAIAAESVLTNEVKIREALHTYKLAENLFLQTFTAGP